MENTGCQHKPKIKDGVEPDFIKEDGNKLYLSDKLVCSLCGVGLNIITKESDEAIAKTRAELKVKQDYAKANPEN